MTEFDRDDITDTMSSFEAAVSARHQEIGQVGAHQVLAALDGSNQDPAAAALALALTARAGASRLHLTYAYEGGSDAARDAYLADRARELAGRAQGIEIRPVRITDAGGRSFEQILALAQRERCDLLITVAPYLDDFAQLGTTSTGTTLDMLLSRRSSPLVVVREAMAGMERCLERVVVPLGLLGNHGALVLAWALRLVERSGTLHLLAVADTEMMESAGSLVGETLDLHEIDERQLAGLVRAETAGLVAATQRRAAADGIGCRVSIRLGEPVEQTVAFARGLERCLMMTGCTDKCSGTAYLRVQALIRESPFPIMVV